MKLGNFSVSLNVKNIEASKSFYEKLGFQVIGGDIEQKWLILSSGTTKIGLFQGMFDENILTFNPKWDDKGNEDTSMDDIRNIYKKLKDENVDFVANINDTEEGPNHFMIKDPDGNTIMFDQHL